MKGWLRQKDADINYGLPKPVQVIESFSGVQYPLIAAMFRAVLSNLEYKRSFDFQMERFLCISCLNLHLFVDWSSNEQGVGGGRQFVLK